ncbi:hypothetical protein diail_1017 [Diaporthe ilicicola]|nr:hypothetical protein diail_1017 [Diaporthe ilicicola]
MLGQIPIRTAAAAPSRLLFRSSFLTTTRRLTTEARPTSQTSTPPPSPQASSSVTPQQPRQLAYLVERTQSKKLSVYNDARAGGTKKQTVVKKIVGDARALKHEIVEELHFPKEDVIINPVTGHIKIKVGCLLLCRTTELYGARERVDTELTASAGPSRRQGAEMVGGAGIMRYWRNIGPVHRRLQ